MWLAVETASIAYGNPTDELRALLRNLALLLLSNMVTLLDIDM
jgi:hypothetical protein